MHLRHAVSKMTPNSTSHTHGITAINVSMKMFLRVARPRRSMLKVRQSSDTKCSPLLNTRSDSRGKRRLHGLEGDLTLGCA